MYSMPIVGTSARLYFPNEVSEDPIITGCVRTNGSSCAKTSDTTNRYFGTEHGSEIEMTPGAVNIKGGSKEPLSISFEDEVGVTLKSPKNLNLSADDDIIIKTPQSIRVKAQSQIGVTKAGTENGFSVETDMHFKGGNVIKDGSCREAFAPFDDEPKAGTKPEPPTPPPEEKKPFDWGKLAKNVLAGLAVVALVTVAAVAIAVTCGAAAPVIGAIAVGAAVAGTAAVASQEISDVKRGEVSDMSAYVSAGAREALIGAVSGAIFGPFGATEALGGKMLLGGVTNAFESVLRQKLNGEDINWGTVLFDGTIGAATGGLFHGAGKMFEKASPFVKKAFNKVSSEISENTKIAKIALSNMKKGPKSVVLGSNLGNVDEALGRFVKEFKKAKNAATEGMTEAEKDIPSAFKQTEFASSYESRIGQTPAKENIKVGFEGDRGESLCTLKPPPDPELKQILDKVGINGIEYRNGVPDFSPTAKAQVEIENMLGGTGKRGTDARRANFVQANEALAEQLNKSPELARKFGMEPGKITPRNIEKYRVDNELTWHELNDVRTIQLVPSKINGTFGHTGGVGEINAGAFEPGGFATK